jgi:hypothetical protein
MLKWLQANAEFGLSKRGASAVSSDDHVRLLLTLAAACALLLIIISAGLQTLNTFYEGCQQGMLFCAGVTCKKTETITVSLLLFETIG